MATHIHHEQKGPDILICAIITLSDTRTEKDDHGGNYIADSLKSAGHDVKDKRIVSDDPEGLKKVLQEFADSREFHLIVTTGGTGIASRDNTISVVKPLLNKTMEGFGELFRSLSYDEIGSRAMLSRSIAGVLGSSLIFCLPGSLNAVKLAMEKLILPDLGHLVWELTR